MRAGCFPGRRVLVWDRAARAGGCPGAGARRVTGVLTAVRGMVVHAVAAGQAPGDVVALLYEVADDRDLPGRRAARTGGWAGGCGPSTGCTSLRCRCRTLDADRAITWPGGMSHNGTRPRRTRS